MTGGRGDKFLFTLQRHFYVFLSLLLIFLLLKVLLEILHTEFVMVFLPPISYVRLFNRWTCKNNFFSLAFLWGNTILAHIWVRICIVFCYSFEWWSRGVVNFSQTSCMKVKPHNTGPAFFRLLPKEKNFTTNMSLQLMRKMALLLMVWYCVDGRCWIKCSEHDVQPELWDDQEVSLG